DPDLVHPLVLARHDALDDLLAACVAVQTCARAEIAADRAVRADRLFLLKLPRPRPEPEIGGGQRADRADGRRVTAELRIERRIADRPNLQATAALVERQHIVADDLIAQAGAARALDATLAVQIDQFAQRDVLIQPDLVVKDEAR